MPNVTLGPGNEALGTQSLAANGDPFASVYFHSRDAFFGVTRLSPVSLADYLEELNPLVDRVTQMAEDILDAQGRNHQVIVQYSGVPHDDFAELERDKLGPRLTAAELAFKTGVDESKIIFVRVDTPWFSSSWENGPCAFTTHCVELIGEAANFVATPQAPAEEIRALLEKAAARHLKKVPETT